MRFPSLLLTTLFIAPIAQAAFLDIEGHSNAQAILYVQERGIVQGYSDGTYKANATINRAEFTKIITSARFSALDIVGCKNQTQRILVDVQLSQWFAQYVCIAQNKGIIGGYPDGTFRPANSINYAEAAKILVTAYDLERGQAGANWYDEYTNAISNLGANVSPPIAAGAALTRGQMAQLIYNLDTALRPDTNGQVTLDGQYTDYRADLVGNGDSAILFFHASWCPHCKSHDAFLTSLYSLNQYSKNVLKINYDSAKDLRATYGVQSQDTFVVLDANGEVVSRTTFPNNATLEELLQ